MSRDRQSWAKLGLVAGVLVAAGLIFFSLTYLTAPEHVAAVPTGAGIPTMCHRSDPWVAVPAAPHGLFVANLNVERSAAQIRHIDRYLLTDPTVCGADIVVPWSSVDRGPGMQPRYDWRVIDRIAQPWATAGKLVNLIVWGVAETTDQQFGQPVTPGYVLRSVHTVTCPGPNHPITPVYWEPSYQDNYRSFIRAVLRRYGPNPDVGFIRFGIGVGDEDYPANGLTGVCLKRWKSYGMSPARWRRYTESMIRFERALDSPKQLLVGLSMLQSFPSLTLPQSIAAAAASYGLGIGIQELDRAAILESRQGAPCYSDWCSLFPRYEGTVPLEVQTLFPTNPSGAGRTGALPALLALALQERAQILELYPQEWLIADVPGYPGYAAYHSVYRHALEAAAIVVGSSVQVVRDVPYVQPASPSRSGDLYLPSPSTRLRPGVIVLHGGGWVLGSKADADAVFLSKRLAEHGDVVFDINYRLVRAGGNFPNDVQDVKDALAFLAAHAATWNIDVHRLAVVGTSAGGHLALMAAYTRNVGMFAPPHYPGSEVHVAAVGDFFGPADLTAFPAADSGGVFAAAHYIGVPYGHDLARYRIASPITYVGHAVPTIIEHGTNDGTVPYAQSVELDSRLRAEGVPQELVTVPGGTHGLDLGTPGAARDFEVGKLEDFLDAAFAAALPPSQNR